ncbi:MAG: NAD-dependent epimerase/dehydratase family protein [Cytophagales bacterium]|nr:NAD-dependent epimerase/dehydratase family protein [Cytophagales bacterium]
MIVVTGAAGFIGSYLIQRLNQDNFNAIIAVDKFDNEVKNKNLVGSKIKERVDRNLFLSWLDKNCETVEFIFHIGACTDTAEFDLNLFNKLNTGYSKEVWKRCCNYQIPLVYASSAANYDLGESGQKNDESKILVLEPVNQHELSKQEFDVWALEQPDKPFFWAGLTLFDVYGKNENSSNEDQKRDFAYVKDVIEVCLCFMYNRKDSGIYNVGLVNDSAKAVFVSKKINIVLNT